MSSRDGHFARRATEDDDEHDDEEHAGDEDGEPGREPLRDRRAADRDPAPEGHEPPPGERRAPQARRRRRAGHARAVVQTESFYDARGRVYLELADATPAEAERGMAMLKKLVG